MTARSGKKGVCPICGRVERLKYILTRKDGFKINECCAECMRRVAMTSYAFRDMSAVIAFSMLLNKEGGVIKIGGQTFKFEPVVTEGSTEYWQGIMDYRRDELEESVKAQQYTETEEERRIRRQRELDELCPPVKEKCYSDFEDSW